METRYDPKQVEEKWYAEWEKAGYFRPDSDRDPKTPKKPYCITIPPPNVTGSLHIGHALCYTIQDVFTRWKRMQGFDVLCLPGTDHAGIATQMVVEKALRAEGTSRLDLGRDKFVERVWEWKKEYGNTIIQQFRRMGFSFEWSRLAFTMDERYVRGVLQTFVDWWENGHIYIGSRVVNWCPSCLTVISDIEVEDGEKPGKLYHVRYPFADGDGYLTVATTRPETMLGDVAVAVNPADERYQGKIGRELILPLVNRPIPVIADEHPDPEFGTGAVKVTPAHDHNDFEIGARHGLPMPVILAEDATIDTSGLIDELGENEYLTRYHGMDRYAARKAVLADLKKLDLLDKVEDYRLVFGTCMRCHSVLEPMLNEQWFVSMGDLSKPAAEVVEEGKVRFVPERFKDIYLRWMANLRDWPVSRQLWWGHQIPAWYCRSCHPEDFASNGDGWRVLKRRAPIVAAEEPKACPHCGSSELIRDPWVLDTWFSSALWPHATLGWPDNTADLARFYPTDVLVTAKDILYLWVARMIMTGLYHIGDVPFRDVFIYATVLNEEGQRMSKSLGTGIDPLEMIDQYGADALRYSLLLQTGTNQEIRFGEKRIEEGRNFANKIWNASRFVLMNLDDEFRASYAGLPEEASLDLVDKWILSRLAATIEAVGGGLDNYNLAESTRPLYEFFWSELCDWYIEAAKPRLADPERKSTVQAVLVHVLERFCRLMHPFMPHIAEEVYTRLPGTGESVCLTEWPEAGERYPEAESTVSVLQEMVRAIRSLRAEVNLPPMRACPKLYVSPHSDVARAALAVQLKLIASQAWFDEVEVGAPDSDVKRVETSAAGADIYLPIEGVIDLEAERARLARDRAKIETELASVKKRLDNPMFVQRAKPEAVEKVRQALDDLVAKLAKVEQRQKLFAE
jgi:valyl-tRNA synthetase